MHNQGRARESLPRWPNRGQLPAVRKSRRQARRPLHFRRLQPPSPKSRSNLSRSRRCPLPFPFPSARQHPMQRGDGSATASAPADQARPQAMTILRVSRPCGKPWQSMCGGRARYSAVLNKSSSRREPSKGCTLPARCCWAPPTSRGWKTPPIEALREFSKAQGGRIAWCAFQLTMPASTLTPAWQWQRMRVLHSSPLRTNIRWECR